MTVEEKVVAILAEKAMLDPSDLTLDSRLDALGIDSLGLVEAIFAYPGLGGLLFESIKANDIFVINGIVTVLILTLGIAVFVIDLTLPILDPRIRRHR